MFWVLSGRVFGKARSDIPPFLRLIGAASWRGIPDSPPEPPRHLTTLPISGGRLGARGVALTEPLLAKRLVLEDAGATGVNVRISLPGESGDELPATVEHVRTLLDQYRAEYPDVEIHAA